MIIVKRLRKSRKDYWAGINDFFPQLSSGVKLVTEQYLLKGLKDKDTYFFGALDTDKNYPYNLAGIAMIFFQWRLEGTLAEIHTVLVDKKYRGQHIGDMLTEAMIGAARKIAQKNAENIPIYLTSKPSREAANRLYQKHGFQLMAAATEDGTNLYKLVITP